MINNVNNMQCMTNNNNHIWQYMIIYIYNNSNHAIKNIIILTCIKKLVRCVTLSNKNNNKK